MLANTLPKCEGAGCGPDAVYAVILKERPVAAVFPNKNRLPGPGFSPAGIAFDVSGF